MIGSITTYLKNLFDGIVQTATAGSQFYDIKMVFDGDPLSYIQQNLPAIVIEPIDSALQKKNQYYEETYRIKISVVVATKQLYWTENTWIIAIKKYIQNMLEKKSSTSSTYDDDSILGVLKKIKCIVVDWDVIANDLYLESIQYSNLSNAWFVGYRADLTIRVFNMQIQWF